MDTKSKALRRDRILREGYPLPCNSETKGPRTTEVRLEEIGENGGLLGYTTLDEFYDRVRLTGR